MQSVSVRRALEPFSDHLEWEHDSPDLGTRVSKIEPPGHGDYSRTYGPFYKGPVAQRKFHQSREKRASSDNGGQKIINPSACLPRGVSTGRF
jgi:hypothetical protein